VAPHKLRKEDNAARIDKVVQSRKKTKKGQEKMRRWAIPDSEYDKVLKHAGDIDLNELSDIDIIDN
jgi:hypothetical protein